MSFFVWGPEFLGCLYSSCNKICFLPALYSHSVGSFSFLFVLHVLHKYATNENKDEKGTFFPSIDRVRFFRLPFHLLHTCATHATHKGTKDCLLNASRERTKNRFCCMNYTSSLTFIHFFLSKLLETDFELYLGMHRNFRG